MTQLEAEDKLLCLCDEGTAMIPLGYADNLIGRIYNDFESMTCDNCHYWHREQITFGICKAGIDQCSMPDLYEFVTKNSFGCNKFKRKTNE